MKHGGALLTSQGAEMLPLGVGAMPKLCDHQSCGCGCCRQCRRGLFVTAERKRCWSGREQLQQLTLSQQQKVRSGRVKAGVEIRGASKESIQDMNHGNLKYYTVITL